jgi:hypothetical protein
VAPEIAHLVGDRVPCGRSGVELVDCVVVRHFVASTM